jgi:hypothetical protein
MTAERKDRDPFSDIADVLLAWFHMPRTYTKADYTLAAPAEG